MQLRVVAVGSSVLADERAWLGAAVGAAVGRAGLAVVSWQEVVVSLVVGLLQRLPRG